MGAVNSAIIVLVIVGVASTAGADCPPAPTNLTEWHQVVGTTSEVCGGFGNPDNIMILHLDRHEGALFAVTYNEQTGAEIWKSQTGIDWTLVHQGGIGSNIATIQDLVSFDGMLYAASASDSNCLWCSPTGTDWAPVEGPCSSPSSPNVGVWELAIFNDQLYAGTQSQFEGCEIWRTSDGESWAPVVTDGFGHSGHQDVSEFEVFGGHLYAATIGTGGCHLWRSADGEAWIQVLDDCFPTYWRIDAMEVFQDTLYAGAGYSGLAGFNLWTSNDGVNWTEGAREPSLLLQATYEKIFSATLGSPYHVLASCDGSEWAPDNEARFGNSNNWRNTGSGVFHGHVYVAARNDVEGCELWRKRVALFADGFESGTTSSWSTTVPSVLP